MEQQISDTVLGQFSYDPDLGWYEGNADWCGTEASLSLSTEVSDELFPAIAAARSLIANCTTWHPRLLDALVQELLPLKNGEWFDPEWDSMTYDRESFLEPVLLQGIVVFPDETAEFHFEAGDLFFGHSLMASVDLKSGSVEANLAG